MLGIRMQTKSRAKSHHLCVYVCVCASNGVFNEVVSRYTSQYEARGPFIPPVDAQLDVSALVSDARKSECGDVNDFRDRNLIAPVLLYPSKISFRLSIMKNED